MTEAETILITTGNLCPDCDIVHPLSWNFCDQCGEPLPAFCCDSQDSPPALATAIEQGCAENEQYEDIVEREVATALLKESPLYNKMVTIGSRNIKGKWYTTKKRLIDMLLSPSGDLLEAISPKAFERLNGHRPYNSCIINHHIIGTNDNEGKVDIYTACDGLYSELGYHSCQEMLNEVEQIKELQRSVK